MNNASSNLQQIHRENETSEFIPYAVQLNNHTIKTHGSDYLQVIKLDGRAHESADPEDIILWKEQLNILLKNITAPNVALWTNIIRREENTYPAGQFKSGFADSLDKKYKQHLTAHKMMVNELYLTIIYRPGRTKVQGFFQRLDKDQASIRYQQQEAIESISELTALVMSSLNAYSPTLLGTYNRKGVLHSELLEFLSFLINGQWQARALPRQDLAKALAYNRIFFGADSFEIRGMTETRVGAMLGISEYPEGTQAGLLNALLSAPFPLILSQSFNFLSKPISTELLHRQQRRMRNAGDLAASQIEAIDDALDDLTSSRIVFGEHHLTLSVYADNAQGLKNNLSGARAELADCAMIVAREDWALGAAFWSQLPGNFKYRPRPAPISSKNFAGFSSFHNYPTGRRKGNQWGPAVTLFKTTSGAPYYFNFHESSDTIKNNKRIQDENESGKYESNNINTGQKALGNTVIIGPSGSGKTVVQGFLMAQSKKFNPTQIIFDKDRGLEIYIRAEGGVYLPLQNGIPTGCNPFQLEPSEANLLFLENLIKKCAGGHFNHQDEYEIMHAVRGVMRLPQSMRKISACLEFLGPVNPEGVSARLAKWCGQGSLAWVFDNTEDAIVFSGTTMFGFDVTAFLDNNEVRTPIVMYLFHRIEQLIDGRRLMIFMDEFWKLLLDEYFEDLAQNKLKVIRKQNGILVFGTQSPKDVLQSPIAHSIIEQCATMIFMPNPKGSYEDYVNGFKLTEREFQLIKEDIQPGSRCFLIKQGHNSTIAELNLKGFNDELAVISGTIDNVQLMNEIIADVGSAPEDWLVEFHKKRSHLT